MRNLFILLLIASVYACKNPTSVESNQNIKIDDLKHNSKDSINSDMLLTVDEIYDYIHSRGNKTILEIGTKKQFDDWHFPQAKHFNFNSFTIQGSPLYGGKDVEQFKVGKALSFTNALPHHRIIIYDNVGGYQAHFLASLLLSYGHKKVGVLNGFKDNWLKKGYDKANDGIKEFHFSQYIFPTKNDSSEFIDFAEIQNATTSEGTFLIDCRSKEEYEGTPYLRDGSVFPWEKGAVTFGHIPKAINISWEEFIDVESDGRIKSHKDIMSLLQSKGLKENDKIYIYSHAGSRSSMVYHILKEVCNRPSVFHYRKGWMGWSRMVKEDKEIKAVSKYSNTEHSRMYSELLSQLKDQ